MVVSGPEQIYANDFVVRLSWETFLAKLPVYLPYAQGGMLGQETLGAYIWVICFLALSGLLFFRNRFKTAGLNSEKLAWIWCGTFIPWILIFIQGVAPPERTLIFKTFFDFLLVTAVGHWALISVFRAPKKLALAVFFTVLLGYASYQTLKLHRQNQVVSVFDFAFNQIVETIWKSKPNYIYTNNSASFYCHYLRYKYISHQQPVPVIDVNTVHSNHPYEYLILEINHPMPEQIRLADYTLWVQNPYGQIYRSRHF